MPEALNTHNGNIHFRNQTYPEPQFRGHKHNNTSFRMTSMSQEQHSFYNRGSPRSDSSPYGCFPNEYYNHAKYNSNMPINGLETIPLAQARGHRNAAQIFGQDTLCIAFSKMRDSSLSWANRLKAVSANLTWTDLKRELSMWYSTIPYDSHATQAFMQLDKLQIGTLTYRFAPCKWASV